MPSSNDAPQAVMDVLARLSASWPTAEWSWDDRHGCATSVLATRAQGEAQTQLSHALPNEWSADTLNRASDDVRGLADLCGGLRPGQKLLSGQNVDGSWPYGLWWPWGDGSAVSIRVGIATGGKPNARMSAALRKLFAIGA